MVFDSTFLKSEYNGGIIEISKGDQEMNLDFNK